MAEKSFNRVNSLHVLFSFAFVSFDTQETPYQLLLDKVYNKNIKYNKIMTRSNKITNIVTK